MDYRIIEELNNDFNVKLCDHQERCLVNSWEKSYSYWLFSRGVGKTFLTAVLGLMKSIKVENNKIGVFCPSFRQSLMVYKELEDLISENDSVIDDVYKTADKWKITFTNKSFIESYPLGLEGKRIHGVRYDTLFLDEFTQFDYKIVSYILLPFVAVKKANNLNKTELVISSCASYMDNHAYYSWLLYRDRADTEKDINYFAARYNFIDLLRDKDSPLQFDLNMVKEMQNNIKPAHFRMEMLAEWIDRESEDEYEPFNFEEDLWEK